MPKDLRRDLLGLRIAQQHAAAVGPRDFDRQLENASEKLIDGIRRADGFFGDPIQHLQVGDRLRPPGVGRNQRRQRLNVVRTRLTDDVGTVIGTWLREQRDLFGD